MDGVHSEDNVPHLFKYPTDSEAIGDSTLERPMAHSHVVTLRPLADAVSGDGKLAAADVANMFGHLGGRNIEKLHVDVGKIGADIVAHDVNVSWLVGMDANGTAGVMLATKVEEASFTDSVKTQVLKNVGGLGTQNIVVPLVGASVDESDNGGEGVVVVDDKGKVGDGFSATVTGRDELVAALWGPGGAVDVGSPSEKSQSVSDEEKAGVIGALRTYRSLRSRIHWMSSSRILAVTMAFSTC